ncbi:MAG: HNH endonuclease, partial [Clostridium perfringens]|nr:HNH endonuclease [Clostridium perfringens]
MDRIKSWEYDDVYNKFAIKDLDKSSFKRGSHIPIKVRKVFECEDIKYG